MVGLDGSDDSDFFVTGGLTPKEVDADGLCVRNKNEASMSFNDCTREVNGRAFIHKNGEWREMAPMPTSRNSEKPMYRVAIQLVQNLPLRLKQKFRFGLAWRFCTSRLLNTKKKMGLRSIAALFMHALQARFVAH